MKLSELETPCLILDRTRLDRNAAAMTERMRSLGVDLRPHMKTAKSFDVAKIAIEGNRGGITVSTLKEAEYFASYGLNDIVYAVSIVPDKLPRLAALIEQGCNVAVITDQPAVARAVGERAAGLGVCFDVLIELDVGEHRAGVTPEAPELIEIGQIVHNSPGTTLKGVLAHAGHSYACRSIEAIRQVAEAERAGAVMGAERLRGADLPCPAISIGSTPTAVHAECLDGVSEVRCGVYLFGDVFQSEVRSCALEDIAVSVLATVIGHHEARNTALIDAGALALSKDRSTAAADLPEDIGYGLVMDELWTQRIGTIRVLNVHQEHGELVSDGPFPYGRLPIGSRVRIFPNHACITSAMYESYQVVENGDEVIATWPRVNGW